MISHTHQIRVAYHDTDQMGFAHHSIYAVYYETARWELFRHIGISYKTIEEMGIIMPVINMSMRFIKPAVYDDMLDIKVTLIELKGVRIRFTYEIIKNGKEMINEGETLLAFVNKGTGKPCHPPYIITSAIHKALSEQIN